MAVDIEKSNDDSPFLNRKDSTNKYDLKKGGTLSSSDTTSDEGIASPSVSPVDTSPDYCSAEILGSSDELQEMKLVY